MHPDWIRRIRVMGVSLWLLPCLLLSATRTVAGQSVGIEVGLAGIENYDPLTPSLGASLSLPIVSRLSLSATYSRWTGRDGNEEALGYGGDVRLGYGNQAFLISGLVRLLGNGGLSMSAGAGIGWFQHFRVENGESNAWYDATPTGSIVVSLSTGGRITPYFRADVQIPREARLNYGLVRFGADIALR